jgi:hypothetical protein
MKPNGCRIPHPEAESIRRQGAVPAESPGTKQHFPIKVQIPLSSLIRLFSPSRTLLPRSLQTIMNRRSLTMVPMTQTVAFTEMITVNPASRSQRERRQPYWPSS